MRGTIVLAGGGTGGHLSPGLAVAERLHSMAADTEVVFACSSRAIDRTMLEAAGARFHPIPAAPFRPTPSGIMRMIRENHRGTRSSSDLIKEVGAGVVLAMGGYVSVPVVRAAIRNRLPIVLLNLDALPGRANCWVARHASAICTAVPLSSHRSLGTPEQVGFPLRRTALAAMDQLGCRERLDLDPSLNTLLVTGASQGASSLNALMQSIVEETPLALSGWQVIHLSGPKDEASLRAAYRKAGVPAHVTSFLGQMGLAWGAADLALSRAGANSVAEASANNVPTLFVPYPHDRKVHQQYNAEPLVRLGGAAIATDAVDVRLNRTSIGVPLIDLLTDPARRSAMRSVLEARPDVDGAAEIARLLLDRC